MVYVFSLANIDECCFASMSYIPLVVACILYFIISVGHIIGNVVK